MGKFKRIPMKDIKTMQKILDDLPDKNLGKTREEAAELLNANILKAIEKGYTVKELADTMAMCGAHSLADIDRSMLFGF